MAESPDIAKDANIRPQMRLCLLGDDMQTGEKVMSSTIVRQNLRGLILNILSFSQFYVCEIDEERL